MYAQKHEEPTLYASHLPCPLKPIHNAHTGLRYPLNNSPHGALQRQVAAMAWKQLRGGVNLRLGMTDGRAYLSYTGGDQLDLALVGGYISCGVHPAHDVAVPVLGLHQPVHRDAVAFETHAPLLNGA